MHSLSFNTEGISDKYFFTMRTSEDALATVSLYNYIHKKIAMNHWYSVRNNKLTYFEFIVNPDHTHVFYIHY